MSDITSKITALLKLFYSLFKGNSEVDETVLNASTEEPKMEEHQTDLETTIESSKIDDDEPDLNTPIEERPEIGAKNKWLYPTNEFGTMEKGVVGSESKEVHERGKKKKIKISRLD